MRLFKSADEKQAESAAETAFRDFIDALRSATPQEATALAKRFTSERPYEPLSRRELNRLSIEAFQEYAARVLADDHLTAEEEESFGDVCAAMQITQQELEESGDIYTRLRIAKLNDGRLPAVDAPHLIPKKGEIVHYETSAALLKEVAVREWRGRSNGVSFRVAKGVRYRVGSTRGHLVTVGTQLQIADTGVLSVTSTRAAYLGNMKTIEMPYAKLIGMELFSDGIRFSLSNRQNAPLFRISSDPDILAATINAAMQAA